LYRSCISSDTKHCLDNVFDTAKLKTIDIALRYITVRAKNMNMYIHKNSVCVRVVIHIYIYNDVYSVDKMYVRVCKKESV